MTRPPAITITEAAAARIQAMLAKRSEPCAGLRIGVKPRGCSGLSYTLDFTTDLKPGDEAITAHGVTVVIDPEAMLYMIGMQMDYVDNGLQAGFNFTNPNEKGRCGCGESFRV